MRSFLKKTAAFLAAGIMATASLGADCFAESTKLTRVELQLSATVAKPTFTVKGSKGVRKIRLSTATSGATIYYTTNGSVPTKNSRVYTGALLKITKDTKIKAIAIKDGVSSAVMTKTFYVATKYGDVTGDNQINQNDYSRLKNYIAGKTEFICKDNADCTGNGGISSKDLTVLGQYLNNTIASLPYNAASTVKKPQATMKKVYGGIQIAYSPQTAGSEIYYTSNGTTPTTSSYRYTAPFTVTQSCQLKAVAYLNGDTSNTYSFSVSVGSLDPVVADKSTAAAYTGAMSVYLSNSNSAARILYTTDGSDPRTSSTANFYSGSIKLTKTTTIKAYAQAKGYADSTVSDFTYSIDAAYTIGGTVWDDTPGTSISSNGVMTSEEAGIAGIPVYLIDSTTPAQDAPIYYIQKTVTDSYGKYVFSNLSESKVYKVVFEYNCQKYRAYNAIVNGGNQALAYTAIDPITVRYNGAYVKTASGETMLNSVTKYSDAINSSYYKMYAITTNSYTTRTDSANLALISKNYGVLDIEASASGYNTSTNTVLNGKTVTFRIKLTNNSPMTINSLTAANVGIYITDVFGGVLEYNQKTTSNYLHFSPTNEGYIFVEWSDFVGNTGLAPGKSAEILFNGIIDSDVSKKVECHVQVLSYQFSTGCYDYNSVPKNMTYGAPKERDEASITPFTVVVDAASTEQSISASTSSVTLKNGESTYPAFSVCVKNAASIAKDVIISNDSYPGLVTCVPQEIRYGNDLYIYFTVTANNVGLKGSSQFSIYLKSNTNKYVTLTATVT